MYKIESLKYRQTKREETKPRYRQDRFSANVTHL